MGEAPTVGFNIRYLPKTELEVLSNSLIEGDDTATIELKVNNIAGRKEQVDELVSKWRQDNISEDYEIDQVEKQLEVKDGISSTIIKYTLSKKRKTEQK